MEQLTQRTFITSDSTCDLTPALLAMNGITTVPLYVSLGEHTFFDGVDMTPDKLFGYFNDTGELPKTAAPSPDDFLGRFTALTKDGSGLVHVSISSELSAAYNNACIAARHCKNVFVVDSRSLSTGVGLIALRGAELAKLGCTAEAIADSLTKAVSLVDVSFIINDLTYLYKGGRCSSIAALGSNLLKIKPCIEVADGSMRVGKKYRGTLKRCIETYITDRLEGRDDLDFDRIFITHTTVEPEILESARRAVESFGVFHEILETDAGSTIASHCGPGTLGILFFKKVDV